MAVRLFTGDLIIEHMFSFTPSRPLREQTAASFKYNSPVTCTGRSSLSPGRYLGWPGSEFRSLLRSCHQGRTVPVRSGWTARVGTGGFAGIHRRGLARLSARCAAGDGVWLPRPWAVSSRPPVTASIRTSFCSTPTPRRWSAICAGRTPISATGSARRATTCRSTGATAPPACRSAGWSIRPSPGAIPSRRAFRGIGRFSTRPMSADTRCGIRPCRRSCRAPTPGWRTRMSSITSAASGSPRSNCCRSTPSWTTGTCWSGACGTSGATTASDSSRPNRAIPRAGPSASSRRWSPASTMPGSR